MTLRVHQVDFYRTDMQTRFPFRYGIASMTGLPHLFVAVEVELEGVHCSGIAADGLPPKWFTKNPSTTFEEDDLPAMLGVIRHAAELAVDLKSQQNLFSWWWELYQAQHSWALNAKIPPLLAGFGISLLERAVIDAVCRQQRTTLFGALKHNAFEIDLATVRPELGAIEVSDVLPDQPRDVIALRHTIGLGDPLSDTDIPKSEKTDDGLPHSLVSNIRAYGLRYFKIKLCGNIDRDRDRMTELASILEREAGSEARFTLDGNEQFENIATFREFWEQFRAIPPVRTLIDHSLLFVEQPLHRRTALDQAVQDALADWPAAPPIIIDESDADLSSLPRALELGYSGTSHKNCKGIIKSVAAAATIAQRGTASSRLILSAEDLANVGPVALMQDLAMVSALGIDHVERNGHHYFAGLSMFPRSLQNRVVADHGDLYQWMDHDFAALAPVDGQLNLESIRRAPFGLAHPPDLSLFQPWEF